MLKQIQRITKENFFTPDLDSYGYWIKMTKLMMMRHKYRRSTRKWVLQTGSKRSRRRDIWMTVGEYWYYHLQVSIYPLYKHSLWNFLGLEKKNRICADIHWKEYQNTNSLFVARILFHNISQITFCFNIIKKLYPLANNDIKVVTFKFFETILF